MLGITPTRYGWQFLNPKHMNLHPIFDESKYSNNRNQFLTSVKEIINACIIAQGTTIKANKGKMISKSIMLTMYNLTQDPAFYVGLIRGGDPNELTNWMK